MTEYHTAQCSQAELLNSILAQLPGSKRSGSSYLRKCPAHDDQRVSLSITPMSGGSIRLKCFAGCDHSAICAALGVEPREVAGSQNHKSDNAVNSKWIYYDYTDERGNLLYQRVRIPQEGRGKEFLQCRPDDRGRKLWTLSAGWFVLEGKKWKRVDQARDPNVCPMPGAVWFDECERVIYRADRVAQLLPGDQMIVTEGEKDVHTLEALGFRATTGGGVGDWQGRFGDDLQGLDIVICVDNDDPGRSLEARIAASCRGKAARIRILRLPNLKEKGDISDWVEAGGTRDQLLKLVEQAVDYEHVLFSNRIASTPTGDDETDPVLTDDPEREAMLRRTAANAGDVLDAIWLLLWALGVKGKHSRIINALTVFVKKSHTVNLGLVRGFHKDIHVEYQSDRPDWTSDDDDKKSNRVSRDLCKFIDMCAEAGAVHKTAVGCFGLVDYKHGSPAYKDRKAIPGSYRLNFLRFALLLLDRAAELGDSREAREQAAREVAIEVLAWVGGRVRDLGEQSSTATEKKTAAKVDPAAKLERNREAALRRLQIYARSLGNDRGAIESALNALKQEVLNDNNNTSDSVITDMSSKIDTVPGRAIATEIEVEYLLKALAEKLRQAWLNQGLNRAQAVIRARSLMIAFILTLFAGSEFKRRKIKTLANSLSNEAIAVAVSVEPPLSCKNAGQGVSASSDQPSLGVAESVPAEGARTVPLGPPPERKRLTDQHYRGPVVYASPGGEVGGKLTAFFDERDGEPCLLFQALDGSGQDGPVPLSALFEVDEELDAELIERWRQSRLGGVAHNARAS